MDILLFSTVGWNIAETTRMIEVAKTFKDEYHCQFMSYGGEFESLIIEEGFNLHKMEPRETPKKIEHLWRVDRGETISQPWTLKEVEARVAAEVALMLDLKPKAVFLGFTLTLPLSTQIADIPLISIMPSALSRPYIQQKNPISPFLPKWIDAIGRYILLRVPLLTRNMRKVAKQYGITPPKTLFDVWEGDVNILTDVKELSLIKNLPEHWYFSGPIYAKLNREIPSEIVKTINNAKNPLVYFAMGSSANKKTLNKALKMLEGLDITVIAPIKTHIDKKTFIPSNVIITDWLPAPEVVPLMDLAFTHGGQGTVQTNVISGVPFLGIGMQPEQTINIYVFDRFGCAKLLHPKRFNKTQVQTTINLLIKNKHYKEKALEAKKIYEDNDGVKIAHDIVKDYLIRNNWPRRNKHA